jgi:hypothetical protein
MARTLQQLKESVEHLIDDQGENAPVAYWIYTNDDVFVMDEDNNPDPVSREIAETVLSTEKAKTKDGKVVTIQEESFEEVLVKEGSEDIKESLSAAVLPTETDPEPSPEPEKEEEDA